jgi:threonine aldolase
MAGLHRARPKGRATATIRHGGGRWQHRPPFVCARSGGSFTGDTLTPRAVIRMASAMRFLSDNAAGVHPAVLDAMARANAAEAPYDGDALSTRLNAAFSTLFETRVTALWVTTGTAANALALAALCPPYRGIVCHRDAHIQTDEAGAPEFYSGGAKLLLVDGPGAKLTPTAIAARLAEIPHDVHRVQPAAISITNATEYGLSYTADDVAAIGDFARSRGLRLHMDGARFANAIVHSGAAPADVTWRAGVDLLSFGFVKNGGLSAEALIVFDEKLADELRIRRKRAGHLLSKGRFLAAQLLALLSEDRWLTNARAANQGAARIAAGAGTRLLYPVEANEVFVRLSPGEAAALRAQGFAFYDWAAGEARFVVSWDQPDEEVAALSAALAALTDDRDA